MRHGQAASPQVDPEQGLTAEGRTEIEQLAARLATQEISPAHVFHSEKTRAQQTAHIMTNTLAPSNNPQMKKGLKPNDDPGDLLDEIESWDTDTLVVSHLPFVPGLLSLLTGQQYGMGYAPGTIFCLNKENGSWQIEWVESP